jgi:hypothetical protein
MSQKAQSPEFKLKSHQKKKNQNNFLASILEPFFQVNKVKS